jgi:tripeptidyl-peptidase-1
MYLTLIRSPLIKLLLACKSYNLPAHVAPHVDLVMPAVHFNTIVHRAVDSPPHFVNRYERITRGLGMPGAGFRSSQMVPTVPILKNQLEHCDEQITPKCLKVLYGIDYTPVATEINTIGACKGLLNKHRCQVLINIHSRGHTTSVYCL